MCFRIEKDTMGTVEVPAEKYWGAQTERSRNNFKIGAESSMPVEVILAFAQLKKAAAIANFECGTLSEKKALLIVRVCDEILANELDGNFPLVIWQTGSGTQTNMNVNEVITNRAHVIEGGKLTDSEKLLHPNDDVNKSQSSNDTFPTAMHIAAMQLVIEKLLPALNKLKTAFANKTTELYDIIKIGRTHFMDATPIRFGQEFSGYVSQLEHGIKALENSISHLSELAIGGTAVGTGLNAPKDFDKKVCRILSKQTNISFIPAPNKFEALAAHDAFVETHSTLKQLAISITKIANDLRFMASGPRCGLAEIFIPENEPGSSIMPGKVNPTQIEAITMVCAQIIGNDAAIGIGAMNGHFELNVYKPLIIKNFIESANLLADASISFVEHCVNGIVVNQKNVDNYLERSLMLVTALNKIIGYEKAAEIAKLAYKENCSLKEAALKTGYISATDFDQAIDPEKMV
ncbi:MAG: class II fumarate hydratase [Lentimicrobiaceae bacterium]|jgi:fumarate hydratase class II|nr:class II fumarate hydratase [Lentimicrobiaceae bacterium]